MYAIRSYYANCAKRFSRGDSSTLHCPDFSEDVLLRKKLQAETEAAGDKKPES